MHDGIDRLQNKLVHLRNGLLLKDVRSYLLVEFASKLLDVFPFLIVAQSDSDTRVAGSCRATDPVQVALRLRRESKVQHTLHVADVETSGHQICRQQVINLVSLEFLD